MASRSVNEIFDNVDRGFGAVFDAARNGNETTARVYRYTIDELERTQRENTELTRRWVESPLDAAGISRAMVETWQVRGRRRAGLARSLVGEIAGAGREARSAAEVVAGAGRSAAQAGLEAGRETVEEAGEELRRGAEKVVERIGEVAQNGRAEVRKVVHRTAETADEAIHDPAGAKRNGSRGGSRPSTSSRSRSSGSQASSSSRGRRSPRKASSRRSGGSSR